METIEIAFFIFLFLFFGLFAWAVFFKKNPNYDKAIKDFQIKEHNKKIKISANENSKKLVETATYAEGTLLTMLSNDNFLENQFKFQEPIFIFNNDENKLIDKYYIADFYFPREKLIVELDGGYHLDEGQKRKDWLRDLDIIENRGIKTIRFNNEEVFDTDIIKSIKSNFKHII